jgi:hypothetical protein
MKKMQISIVLPTLLCALAAVPALGRAAQRTPSQKAAVPAYDAAHEVALQGTVEKVVAKPAADSPLGLHLLVDTPVGSVDAHLGLLREKQASQAGIVPGAAIEMVGAMTQVGGKELLIVRKLTVGGRTMTLRNKRGFPIFQMAPRASSGKIILRGGQR